MSETDRTHRNNVPAARRLRRPLTDAEALVWERVRDRRFRGLKFRRQHPIGALVADFHCAELSLVLEVDGGIHMDPEQHARDRERELVLQDLGLRVVRITNAQVRADLDGALNRVLR